MKLADIVAIIFSGELTIRLAPNESVFLQEHEIDGGDEAEEGGGMVPV